MKESKNKDKNKKQKTYIKHKKKIKT